MPYVLMKKCQQKTADGKYINSLPGDPVVYPESWPKKEIWINSGYIRRVTQNEFDAIQVDVAEIETAAKKAAATKEKAEKAGRQSRVHVPSAADQLAHRLAALRKPR